MNDVLGDFIPDFRYLVVPLSKYTNQELVDKGDELSLIMLNSELLTGEGYDLSADDRFRGGQTEVCNPV